MAALSRIAIYPLKSFDPILVDEAEVLSNGGLQHDRRFALVDSAGKFVNAKRTPLVHRLEVLLDPVARTLSVGIRTDESRQRWQIDSERDLVERWFSEYFGTDVTLVENTDGGFPDDLEAPGPTIVSQATLQSVAGWFGGLSLDQVRLRFRANLELTDCDSFWEDRLYGASDGVARAFRLGEVILAGTNPCQRCVVPTRDAATGEVWPEFSKRFAALRDAQLPDWAPRARFNHYYRLAVNTRLISNGSGRIRIGDPVELTHLDP